MTEGDPGAVGPGGVSVILAIVAAAIVAVASVRLRPRRVGSEPDSASLRAHADALGPDVRQVIGGIGGAISEWRHRRASPSARAVAAWCDDVARRVRSGSSLRDAAVTVPGDAVTARATAPFRVAIDRGLSLGEAADRVVDPGSHLRLALGMIATTSRLGGPAAASIDRTAMLLRQRAADQEERSSQAAQARLSTHVMTAIPLLMLATLVATDADVRSVVGSPIGIICIATGLLLNALGWWWMRRIVRTPT